MFDARSIKPARAARHVDSTSARFAQDRAVLTWLAAASPMVSLVWADGAYVISVDFTLLAWARDALGIVKRTDDSRGFKVLPRRGVVRPCPTW